MHNRIHSNFSGSGWRTDFSKVRERGREVAATATALEVAQPELLPLTAPAIAAGTVAASLTDFDSKGRFFFGGGYMHRHSALFCQ